MYRSSFFLNHSAREIQERKIHIATAKRTPKAVAESKETLIARKVLTSSQVAEIEKLTDGGIRLNLLNSPAGILALEQTWLTVEQIKELPTPGHLMALIQAYKKNPKMVQVITPELANSTPDCHLFYRTVEFAERLQMSPKQLKLQPGYLDPNDYKYIFSPSPA